MRAEGVSARELRSSLSSCQCSPVASDSPNSVLLVQIQIQSLSPQESFPDSESNSSFPSVQSYLSISVQKRGFIILTAA